MKIYNFKNQTNEDGDCVFVPINLIFFSQFIENIIILIVALLPIDRYQHTITPVTLKGLRQEFIT